MKILTPALHKTSGVARDTLHALSQTDARLVLVDAALFLAVTAGAFTAFLVTETGAAILDELHRRRRLRAPRPESPSLRGTPTPGEIAAACAATPRRLAEQLRLGSMLADLDPTLDRTFAYTELPNGAKRYRARGGGMKAYLADHRIPVPYSTLMRYKLLAVRLRRLLVLDARLPLEWLLPRAEPDGELPADLRAPYGAARRRLARLLRENPNYTRLRRRVDAALGIPELLWARRNACGERARRRAARGARGRVVRGGTRHMTIDPERIEATRLAMADFLQDRNLSPKFARLRDAAIRWLRGPPVPYGGETAPFPARRGTSGEG